MHQSTMMRALSILASLRLTAFGMVLLLLTTLLAYKHPALPLAGLVLPLGLLALNLLAAMIYNPRFRRQGGLLVFHIALLMILVLAGSSLMLRLDARLEIAQGQVFDAGDVEIINRGPWHRWRLDQVKFQQGTVSVDYLPNLMRQATQSVVNVREASQQTDLQVMDNRPMTLSGYRFTTTSNKGYAVILSWLDENGDMITGALHMPSYPMHDWKQSNQWTTPRGQHITVELLGYQHPPMDREWMFDGSRLQDMSIRLVKTANDATELKPGQATQLQGGVLRLEAVRLWMGYRIDYIPLLPWLFTAAFIGILGMVWHFWGKFWRPAPVESSAREPIAGLRQAV